MKIVLFSGSLRRGSFNKKLISCLKMMPALWRHEVMEFDLQTAKLPIYDGDLEEESGIPPGLTKLAEMISQADALIVSSPEYNGSIASSLKTAIDWLSRMNPFPLEGKHLLLLSASPGGLGGVRGLWQTRIPFEVLGVHVYPTMFGLPRAHEAFDAEGQLQVPAMRQRLESLVNEFLLFLEKPTK